MKVLTITEKENHKKHINKYGNWFNMQDLKDLYEFIWVNYKPGKIRNLFLNEIDDQITFIRNINQVNNKA